MLVFVDTSAWIAVCIANDIHHNPAREKLDRLVKEKDVLVTSNYVLDETYTRLRYDTGLEAAITFHNLVMESALNGDLLLERINEKIEEIAWNIFVSYQDQDFSYTDCTSFALCGEIGIKRAFAFDKHFSVMGFILI